MDVLSFPGKRLKGCVRLLKLICWEIDVDQAQGNYVVAKNDLLLFVPVSYSLILRCCFHFYRA